ncbi:MAG: hypothetical protein WAN35_03560 [Terracidiphilus sp.]
MIAEPRQPLRAAWAKVLVLLSAWTAAKALLFPVIDVLPIDNTTRQWVEFGIYAILVLISFMIWIRSFMEPLKRYLTSAVPWLVAIVLGLNVVMLVMVRLLRTNPPQLDVAIAFDLTHGQIFNSWEDPASRQTKYIYAFGALNEPLLWDISRDSSDEASFSYSTDSQLRPSDGASSGGYQTFYNKPCDRRIFHKIVFSLQSAESCGKGKADVGLRLTMDNPIDKREYFTYELPSLKKKVRIIDGSWRQYEIPISELERVPRANAIGPLPFGLDENTLNKVVFFVNNPIVSQCPRNTLRIKEIRLQP